MPAGIGLAYAFMLCLFLARIGAVFLKLMRTVFLIAMLTFLTIPALGYTEDRLFLRRMISLCAPLRRYSMEVKKINDKEYLHWLKMFYIGVTVHLFLNA